MGNNIECKGNNYWLQLDVRFEKDTMGKKTHQCLDGGKMVMPFTGMLNSKREDGLKRRNSR